jgi:hypothetical protein
MAYTNRASQQTLSSRRAILHFRASLRSTPSCGTFSTRFARRQAFRTERIFCVPGNHDIDRSRQKLCFKGARSCVSRLVIDDIHLAIVGLDSTWIAEGGRSDHGKLLIGERQVINAVTLAQSAEDPPHVVITMAHHPYHLLREFDRPLVQGHIERGSQFFRCGHLHLPEARAVGQSSTGCLVLAAGASFETRQSQNTFSVITIDLLSAKRLVMTIHNEPKTGRFRLNRSRNLRSRLPQGRHATSASWRQSSAPTVKSYGIMRPILPR